MFCGNCGKKVPDGVAFCPECGSKFTSDNLKSSEITYVRKTKRSKKIPILVISIAVVACIVALVFKVADLSKPKYDKYEDVLQVCCDAINKKNKKLLDDVVYEKLGSDWNDEHVYRIVDDFYEYQIENDENYGKLTTDIDRYEHFTSRYDLDEAEEEFFNMTGKMVNFDEAYEIEMDNESCMEIALIKAEGRWFVLYLDL